MITSEILESKTKKYFKSEKFQMISEDGRNELQCQATVDLGKTKKGTFADIKIDHLIVNDGNYCFYMLENIIPNDIYSAIVRIPNDENIKNFVIEAAKSNGFEIQGSGSNSKLVKAFKENITK